LDNARPISTQRWYHEGAKGVAGRWTDADFEEFKKVIDQEIQDIMDAWDTGNYDADLQPEDVYYYSQSVECKAKWDITQRWNLTQEPRNRQKPREIIQQKADKDKKRLQNRNADRAKKLGIEYVKRATP
jgi:phage/plasmid-associated DNA primase